MKGDVVYYDEIVKELSEEHGIPEWEMREICASSLNYIKELASDKDTLSIMIPNLGYLYFSTPIAKVVHKSYSDSNFSDFYQEAIDKLGHKLERVEKESGEEAKTIRHKQRPFLYKFKNILKKLKVFDSKRGATFSPEDVWSKVAEIQNETNANN